MIHVAMPDAMQQEHQEAGVSQGLLLDRDGAPSARRWHLTDQAARAAASGMARGVVARDSSRWLRKRFLIGSRDKLPSGDSPSKNNSLT